MNINSFIGLIVLDSDDNIIPYEGKVLLDEDEVRVLLSDNPSADAYEVEIRKMGIYQRGAISDKKARRG